jgi:hypothetical protein
MAQRNHSIALGSAPGLSADKHLALKVLFIRDISSIRAVD